MQAQVNGIRIDYHDEGHGTPLMFLHAFPLNRTMWDYQAQALRNRFRVVIPDLRGFGNSGVSKEPSLMDQHAADMNKLLGSLGIDKAVLIGLSMGGYIALAFYRNYPERVRAMVWADTRAGADKPEARNGRLKAAEKAEREGARAIADEMIPRLLGRTTLETRPEVIERVRTMVEANSPQGIAAAQRGMAERPDSNDLLEQVKVPVLILVGSEDTLTPPNEAEAMKRLTAGASLRVIEGAGHLSNLERPEEFNAALLEFLNALPD